MLPRRRGRRPAPRLIYIDIVLLFRPCEEFPYLAAPGLLHHPWLYPLSCYLELIMADTSKRISSDASHSQLLTIMCELRKLLEISRMALSKCDVIYRF